MEEFDMSRPGSELFPETSNAQYNSYQDVISGHDVGDPLDTGATIPAVAEQESEQQLNFKALREEIAKMKEEREYWKGQAEAYSHASKGEPYRNTQEEDAFSALDWDDSDNVKKAFNSIRKENQDLRTEIKDALTAIETKSQRQDWNTMVTQHVPQLTSKNPIFAEMIKNVSNPYEAAYVLAELNARASQSGNVPQGNGQRAIANANKPQTLASVGGHGQLSKVDYYANMSDKDFMEIAARNLANI